MNHTKASNALVATVDFYAALTAELTERIKAEDALITQLGDQVRLLANHEELENAVLSAAVDYWDAISTKNHDALLEAVNKMIEANHE